MKTALRVSLISSILAGFLLVLASPFAYAEDSVLYPTIIITQSGGGANITNSSFLDLLDTPDTYTTSENFFVQVYSSALRFFDLFTWVTDYAYNKSDVYNKSEADSTFLTDYDETDPIWTAAESNYYNKTEVYNITEINQTISQFIFTGSVVTIDGNYVSSDANKRMFKSFSDAYDHINAGDLVVIYPAIYNENVQVKREVKYKGLDRITTIINSTNDTIIIPQDEGDIDPSVYIEGVTIQADDNRRVINFEGQTRFDDVIIQSNGVGSGATIYIGTDGVDAYTSVVFYDSTISVITNSSKEVGVQVGFGFYDSSVGREIFLTGSGAVSSGVTAKGSNFDVSYIYLNVTGGGIDISDCGWYSEGTDTFVLDAPSGKLGRIWIRSSSMGSDGMTTLRVYKNSTDVWMEGNTFVGAVDMNISEGASLTNARVNDNYFEGTWDIAGSMDYTGLNLFALDSEMVSSETMVLPRVYVEKDDMAGLYLHNDPSGYEDSDGFGWYLDDEMSATFNHFEEAGMYFNTNNTNALAIDSEQEVYVSNLGGSGNQYVCVDNDGKLYKSGTGCIP